MVRSRRLRPGGAGPGRPPPSRRRPGRGRRPARRVRPARAADDLRRHDALPHVGDILVNSALDPVTDEVAAFEELIGCHGGLGGWQNRPLLIHPATWPVETELIGADAVHRQLVRWLERLGQRAGLREPAHPAVV